jgi:hypothetical protein
MNACYACLAHSEHTLTRIALLTNIVVVLITIDLALTTTCMQLQQQHNITEGVSPSLNSYISAVTACSKGKQWRTCIKLMETIASNKVSSHNLNNIMQSLDAYSMYCINARITSACEARSNSVTTECMCCRLVLTVVVILLSLFRFLYTDAAGR